MQIGTVILVNDLIGFYVGSKGLMTLIQDGDGKVREVMIGDKLENHEVANPHALAHIYYDKLVSKVIEERNKKAVSDGSLGGSR